MDKDIETICNPVNWGEDHDRRSANRRMRTPKGELIIEVAFTESEIAALLPELDYAMISTTRERRLALERIKSTLNTGRLLAMHHATQLDLDVAHKRRGGE